MISLTSRRIRILKQTKAGLSSSPTTFSFRIPEKKVQILSVKVNVSLIASAFRNYGIYAVKSGGETRIVGGAKLTPLTLTSPSGTGGGGASGASGGGGAGGATLLSVLENEDLKVIVNHGGDATNNEKITVTVEYEVLEP